VPEAMMVEPTEDESLQTLDHFIETMKRFAKESQTDPEKFHASPTTTPVRRLDEVAAARQPILRWAKRGETGRREAPVSRL